MKEFVILSGKGGTGKTSIVSSFAACAKNAVLADCDVDAADLHLVLKPSIKQEEEFVAGQEAITDMKKCTQCGRCLDLCRFSAVNNDFSIDSLACEGCGVCAHFCPSEAITMHKKVAGKWFVSDTDHGPMVHARLGIAEENSGRLVTQVRKAARKIAEENGSDCIIVDGSPGIGCPVIASITGASMVFIVCEPTVSGVHDLERVVELLKHFDIPGAACINKYDLNPGLSQEIEKNCSAQGISVLGKIPYDPVFTKAQIAGKSVVDFEGEEGAVASLIREMWSRIADEYL